MKNHGEPDDPEMLPEYDFRGGERGKYVERYTRSQIKEAAEAPFVVSGGDSLLDALRRSLHLPKDAHPEVFIGAMGGATWCSVGSDGPARKFGQALGCSVEIGTTLGLVFDHFVKDRPVSVSISGPSGDLVTAGLRQDRWSGWDWTPMPGSSEGRYTVTGMQGQESRQGFLEVIKATSPVASVLPDAIRPGAAVLIALAGYLPHQMISMMLYRWIGEGLVVVDAEQDIHGFMKIYRFEGELRPVRADSRGEASYFIATSTADAPGTYVLETLPEARKGGAFGDRVFTVLNYGQDHIDSPLAS